MKLFSMGILTGLVIGVMFGAGMFGFVGGVVGALLGAVVGGATLAPFVFGAAEVQATKPHGIVCPVTREPVEVTFEPRSAGWSVLTGSTPKVVHCSRWREIGECDHACEHGMDLRASA